MPCGSVPPQPSSWGPARHERSLRVNFHCVVYLIRSCLSRSHLLPSPVPIHLELKELLLLNLGNGNVIRRGRGHAEENIALIDDVLRQHARALVDSAACQLRGTCHAHAHGAVVADLDPCARGWRRKWGGSGQTRGRLENGRRCVLGRAGAGLPSAARTGLPSACRRPRGAAHPPLGPSSPSPCSMQASRTVCPSSTCSLCLVPSRVVTVTGVARSRRRRGRDVVEPNAGHLAPRGRTAVAREVEVTRAVSIVFLNVSASARCQGLSRPPTDPKCLDPPRARPKGILGSAATPRRRR